MRERLALLVLARSLFSPTLSSRRLTIPLVRAFMHVMLEVMKLLILYRPDSEHARLVEDFVRDFSRQYDAGQRIEMVSLNTRDGAATASIYDVMQYPAILVLAEDGRPLNVWQGTPLPLMDEVAGYMYSGQ